MNSIYFTEEHEVFRQSLKEFLQREVVPHVEKWEKEGTIERFIWKKMGEMGYFGLNVPEAYGGLDLDLFYSWINCISNIFFNGRLVLPRNFKSTWFVMRVHSNAGKTNKNVLRKGINRKSRTLSSAVK